MVDIFTETDMFGRLLITREVELLLWSLVIFLLILFATRFWRLSRKVSPDTFVNIHGAEFLLCVLFAIAKGIDILYDFYVSPSMPWRHVLEQISLTLGFAGFAGFAFLIWVIEKTVIRKTRFILSLIPLLGIVYIWIWWIGPTGPSFDLIFIIIMIGITLVPFATYIVMAFKLRKEIQRQALLIGIGLIFVVGPFGLEYEVLSHLEFGNAIINFYTQIMTVLGMPWNSYYFWPQQVIIVGFVFLYFGILKYWK